MSILTAPTSAPRVSRLIGLALALGGALWVTNFMQIIINGTLTGSLPSSSDDQLPFYLRIGLRLFIMSILILNVGLVGLLRRTLNRSKKLSVAASLFMVIAIVLASINTATMSGLLGAPTFNDTLMGLSIFATSIATGLLSVAALRAALLPRSIALPLLFVGITTIPVLFNTPLPIGPDWATDYLAFLTSGAAYTIAGAQLCARHPRGRSAVAGTALIEAN